jgi:hypothetical protein
VRDFVPLGYISATLRAGRARRPAGVEPPELVDYAKGRSPAG